MKVPELPYVSARLWWRAFLLVAAYTGLRVGEIMRLRFADLKGDWITVKGTNRKNRKGKKQYLPAIALRAIGDITTEREFIFEYPGYFSGTKARPRNFARRFKTLLNKARIPPARRFGFHGLRKLHAGIIAENEESLSQGGDGIKAAQASLGHGADSTTTTYYVPASVQDKIAAAAIERLPNITPPSEIQRRLFDE